MQSAMWSARSRTLVCFLILCLCYTTLAAPGRHPIAWAAPPHQAATAADPLAQIINNLPAIKKLIDKIQRQLDQSQVDLDKPKQPQTRPLPPPRQMRISS